MGRLELASSKICWALLTGCVLPIGLLSIKNVDSICSSLRTSPISFVPLVATWDSNLIMLICFTGENIVISPVGDGYERCIKANVAFIEASVKQCRWRSQLSTTRFLLILVLLKSFRNLLASGKHHERHLVLLFRVLVVLHHCVVANHPGSSH